MKESDETLVARMLDGEEDAFTTLYRRSQGAVYRFALHMTRSIAVAEDVTQEVFLALLESARRFDPSRGTLLSFLFGIARNRVWQRIEKDWRIEPVAVIEGDVSAEDLMDNLTRRETVECVRQAIVSLPPIYREAVVLCDLENATYEEAAAALDCPVGTLRSRLNRGRAMLAQKLTRHVVRTGYE
jgi:RNA polymerase sigma-70 factor, ECF subfamily